MPAREAEKWILPISNANKDLLKSIAICTNTPMCDLADLAIREFIERLKEGDFTHNLSEMKRKRNEYLKMKKMVNELEKIKSEYSQTMQELGIEQLTKETLTK